MRSAVDIRNIDVEAASRGRRAGDPRRGGLRAVGRRAGAGLLVDLSRGVSRAAAAYHAGEKPEIRVGRQLAGSTVGIIGYGRIARELAPLLAAWA